MDECPGCGERVEARFRFCPWCAVPLRRKLTEFFLAHPDVAGDAGRALRVSRYLAADEVRHVRFSIWSDDARPQPRAEAAVSITEQEAARLAAFVSSPEEEAVDPRRFARS